MLSLLAEADVLMSGLSERITLGTDATRPLSGGSGDPG